MRENAKKLLGDINNEDKNQGNTGLIKLIPMNRNTSPRNYNKSVQNTSVFTTLIKILIHIIILLINIVNNKIK